MADGSVVFKIDLDTKSLKEDLATAEKELTSWAESVANKLTIPVGVESAAATASFNKLQASEQNAAEAAGELSSKLPKVSDEMDGVSDAASQGAGQMNSFQQAAAGLSKKLTGFYVASKALQALWAAAKAGVSYNAKMEEYETNFAVLLGDEAKALQYVAEMRKTAAKTPFGMEDLANANQTLLSFGLSAEESSAAVNMLGDISLGNAERFNSLALAFAQVSSAGKLTGQDLLQMINAGFNPLNTIAEKTGTNIGDLKEVMAGGKGSKEFQKQMKAAQSEVKKMGDQASEGAKWLARIGEDGAISAEMIGLAMQAETAPGGRFYQGMEMASQTLGGVWSTLKDDTMQLAGNLFEPVTNGLKNIVLPAAQSVVSGLNSLFEKDNTVVVSADVQQAIDNVTSLDNDILALKNKWQTDVIKIRLDAENAQELVGELEAVQAKLEGTPKRLWSEEDKAALQQITSELVGIYPELQKYVSNDGILKAEAETVRALIGEYNDLALAKAAAEYKGEAEKRLLDAQVQHELLKENVSQMESQKKAAEDAQKAWQGLAEESSASSNQLAFAAMTGGTVDTASIEGYLALVQQYIDMGGRMDTLDQSAFDLTHIFGETGELLSAEEVAASADSLASLAELLSQINEQSYTQEEGQAAVVQQLTTDINAASSALLESAQNIASTAAEVERVKAVIQRIQSVESGSGGSSSDPNADKAAGTKIAENTAQGVEESAPKVEEALQGTVDQSISSADTSGANSIGFQLASGIAQGARSGSSVLNAAIVALIKGALKAGRDAAMINSPSKLFEQEIGAYLPAGAARGVAKNAWMLDDAVALMIGRSLPDVSGIASGIVQRPMSTFAAMPAVSAQSGKSVYQTINFNVPVQTPDEFAQTMFLYNTYGLTEA